MSGCKSIATPHCIFIWTLENVSEWIDLNQASPPFVADTIGKSEWRLVLCERDGKLLCVPCKRHDDSGLERIEIEYETSVIAANGSILNEKRQRRFFKPEFTFKVIGSSNVGENIVLEQKDKLDLKGTLTIRCRMWQPENESGNSSYCFAHTRLKQERRFFTWTIPEFSSLTVEKRRSFYLQVTPRGALLRVLDLYLKNDEGEDKVCIEKPKELPYRVFCKVSVMSATGDVVSSKNISDNAALIKMSKLTDNKSLCLPNDVLHLRCEYKIDFGVVSNCIENYENFSIPTSRQIIKTMAINEDWSEESPFCPCNYSLKKALQKYYENGELTDVNLRAGDETFPAHKIVLSAKSKVFEEMFIKDKSKKGRKSIELNDFEPDILRRLLLYIYFNVVEDQLTTKSAMKLYKAAIRYEIQYLKERCSVFLASELSMANIYDVVSFAEKHHDDILKGATRMFISIYDADIFNSVDWKNFKKRNPIIAMDVMQSASEMRNFISSITSQFSQQGDD